VTAKLLSLATSTLEHTIIGALQPYMLFKSGPLFLAHFSGYHKNPHFKISTLTHTAIKPRLSLISYTVALCQVHSPNKALD